MPTITPQVISVSRRTDIPAYYSEWFMLRIQAGVVRYRNPFGGQEYEVSLKPEDVLAFVFWSRDYAPLLPHLETLDSLGYSGYFHFTLTDYGPPLEPYAPPADAVFRTFHALASHYSPAHVLWRFDPIALSNSMTAEVILEKFTALAARLCGATERCYISFVDFYRKMEKKFALLRTQGIQYRDPSLEEKVRLTQELVKIGAKYNIRLYACCEKEILFESGVQQAHCVDALLLRELFPQKYRRLKSAPTREGCGCFASRDIGAYDTCTRGCLYCYANASHAKALARFRAHDPCSVSIHARVH